jgi:uncharacterized membrane protein (UPF0136 family)
MINDPISILCYACALIGYLVGLFAEINKEALITGANTMLEIATKLLEKKRKMGDRLLLKERPDDDEKN